MIYVVIHFSINVFGIKNVVYHLVYTLHQGVNLWIFIEMNMGVMAKSFNKGVNYRLNLEPLSNTTSRGLGYLHRQELTVLYQHKIMFIYP